ncbi:MAG: glycosyltransferase [Prevotella sp.]|nr:glycosyltransferase [Prevotella sp.]
MIRFSVITCTYNAAPVLQRTLDSLLRQTHHQVEHIIVDGRSEDATLQMAMAYKQESDASDNAHDVIVISEPDHGLYDAMNKGLQMASGSYVVFLNAGDALPSADTLELIDGAVGEDETLPGVLYGDTDITDLAGRVLYPRRLRPPRHLSWRSFLHGMTVCHQAFYARTDLAKACPYDLRYRFSADVDWCIRVMKAADSLQLPLRNLNMTVVNYLEGGLTTANHRASLRERFRVMRVHYGLLPTLFMHVWFLFRTVVSRFRR